MFDDNLMERFEMSMERIREIAEEESNKGGNAVNGYFAEITTFILMMDEHIRLINADAFDAYSVEELAAYNNRLFEDVIGEAYENSYANPAYAVEKLGDGLGQMLSFLYVELRGIIPLAYEKRLFDITIVLELFIEIYCIVNGDEEDVNKSVKSAIYWYVSDYSDVTIEQRVLEQLDTSKDFAYNIVMNSDLSNESFLYKYGEYITENETKLWKYLNTLSDEKIKLMADTFVEGYRKGFELGNKDITKKKTVNIRYCVGFERLVRAEIEGFKRIGLETTIYRAAVNSINKRMNLKIGYYSTNPNKQMDYDHRFDDALYFDKDFVERKLGAVKLAYQNNAAIADVFGGPAVMEVFGEAPFEPVNKPECLQLDERQRKLSVRYSNESARIVNEYIKGEERSFTIIAYPIPEIGDDFEAIFDETVKINTLDYELYKDIQQNIIDALDGCHHVEIKGTNGNCTDMKVSIMQMTNPQKQTVFENCVADVNIPLGEVFTSPVLKHTEGILNVSEVYLNDLKFKNLKVTFKDGMVDDYTCDNFEDAEANKAFIKENVLFNHDTLPIGEFAIGTNTTAYVMANRYDIVYKLPILIVEKMGPHFAVGDTCYTWCEDTAVYNPNGKEIIARDNEVSIMRKEKPDKAYFNCHTDITIPYDEIGTITAVYEDGSAIEIIRDGRFVLDGTQKLNEAFHE